MVLRRGRFGMFMACPGYNEDPPCKTIRKLSQKQQQKPPDPPMKTAPSAASSWCCATVSTANSYPAPAIPSANTSSRTIEGVEVPQVRRWRHRGDARRGAATSSRAAPIIRSATSPRITSRCRNKCPECGSPYLVEKSLKSGIFLDCPNNKKTAAEDEAPKKRKKKADDDSAASVACSYSKRIGDAPVVETPTAATHGPVLEPATPAR